MVPSEALAGLAGAAALFAAPGAGLAELLPGVRDLPPARRLAHAYLLGLAWTAGLLYALSHFLAVPLRRPAILAVAALPAAAGLAWRLLRRRGPAAVIPDRQRRRRPDLLARTAVAVGVALSLGILCDVLTNPLVDWDGRMTWGAQARYVRHEGTVDASVFTQRGWYVTHPWYPLLLPVAQAAVLELTGAGDDQPLYRPLYGLFFPVWLLILYGGARRWAGRQAAALTALSAALLPFPAFYRNGGATGAYSDLPLACFYAAGLLMLLKPRPRPSEGVAAGLLLGAAALTKAEGAPLALAALALAALAPLVSRAGRRAFPRRWRALGLAAVPVALALGLLFSWRAGIPDRLESYREIISWSNLWPGAVTGAPFLLVKIRYEMIALKDWGFFWSVAPLVLLAGWRGLRRRAAAPLALAGLAPLAVGWIACSLSLDPAAIVRTSWNRFVLQALIPLLLVFALALADVLRRASWLPWYLGGPARSPRRDPRTRAGSPPSAARSSSAPDRSTASG